MVIDDSTETKKIDAMVNTVVVDVVHDKVVTLVNVASDNIKNGNNYNFLPDLVEPWIIKLKACSSYHANESLSVQVTLWCFRSVENAPLYFLVASTCSTDLSEFFQDVITC